jgi:archaellum component FlaC
VNIDERLERLTERHEALSNTVELLTHDIDALRDALRAEGKETGEKIRALALIAEQNEVRASQMMEAITRLARTVEAHERRLDEAS